MISKRYSAEFKRNLVQKYFKEKEKNLKLTKTEFAVENGVPDSTFIDWVLKYEREGIGFCNITNEIKKLDDFEIIDVNVHQQNQIKIINEETSTLSQNKVKLKYNGAVIEFDDSLLERVLGILKSW